MLVSNTNTPDRVAFRERGLSSDSRLDFCNRSVHSTCFGGPSLTDHPFRPSIDCTSMTIVGVNSSSSHLCLGYHWRDSTSFFCLESQRVNAKHVPLIVHPLVLDRLAMWVNSTALVLYRVLQTDVTLRMYSHGPCHRSCYIFHSFIHPVSKVQNRRHLLYVFYFRFPELVFSSICSSGLGSSCLADIVITATMVLYLVRFHLHPHISYPHWHDDQRRHRTGFSQTDHQIDRIIRGKVIHRSAYYLRASDHQHPYQWPCIQVGRTPPIPSRSADTDIPQGLATALWA